MSGFSEIRLCKINYRLRQKKNATCHLLSFFLLCWFVTKKFNGKDKVLGRVDIELTAKPKHLQPDKYWLQKMCPSSRNASLSF